MFRIPKIENSEFYIDQAMKHMQEYALKERDSITKRFANLERQKKKSTDVVNLDKRKDLELIKIRFLNESIHRKLKKLHSSFPKFKKVDEIYLKLINTSEIKVKKIESSLETLNKISYSIDELTQNIEHKIKYAKTQETVGFIMKKYLGKVNSYFKKNKYAFEDLDTSRKFLNKMPTFEDLFTIAIAGFPNVGKSTLMKAITGSDVEIQNYPFTTKGLMFGYVTDKGQKAIQLIDTPGLLGRDKQNDIEQRAQIIITDYTDSLVFVIDFTESCGFTIESQMKLLKKTAENKDKNIVLYLSKKDLYNEETDENVKEVERKIKKYKQFTDVEKIKQYMIDEKNKLIKKFNPKSLSLIK